MKFIEKHPLLMIFTGIFGISLSSIFVKYSAAPSAVTAAFRLLWTVLLMTPVVLGRKRVRTELFRVSPRICLLGRIVRETVSTAVYTYLVYTVCAASLLLFCAFQGHRLFAHGISAVLVGLLLAVFSTILGHSIFSWCLKYFSPAFVSASKLCEPVVAAVFAVFLFGELPGLIQILGSLLILGGVIYYSGLESRKR